MSEGFCWMSRKVAIPVMCCVERRRPQVQKENTVYLWVCVTSASKACIASFFRWQEPPWKQRRYSTTFRSEAAQIECVTHRHEGEGRGAWNRCKSQKKKCTSQMVMVETSVHSEFPAAVPCLNPLDYFLVQGLLHFKASSRPSSVIWPC